MSVSVEPLRRQKDTDYIVRVFCLVGVARLELAALRSRTVRATKLRYTPKSIVVNFDCLCNIHQFEHFCNKNKSIILKIMFYAIIFLSL